VTNRVVVTGAAGMIGTELVRRCRDRGDRVVGVDQQAFDEPGVDTVTLELGSPAPSDRSRPELLAALDGADLVIHAAAIVAESGDRQRFVEVNVGGTRSVLEASAAVDVGRVVHLSSIVVYGGAYPAGAMLDEDAPVVPTGGPYTDTKIGAEHAALQVAGATGVPLTIVRPGDVYGARSVSWVLRPIDLLRRGLFVLVDGGRWPLSPIHVDDVVAGILSAGASPGAVGRIYNLAGGQVPCATFFGHHARYVGVSPRSLPRAAARAAASTASFGAQALGREVPFGPEVVEYVTHPGGYATVRARTELGWAPEVELAEGLARSFSDMPA
jgi:2-alkyl-3-oxoalkanoate reductase